MNRLNDLTCIVTGAANGIGKATCKRLAEEGAPVAVTDLDDDSVASVCDAIIQSGGTAEYWHLDVSDEAEVVRVFSEIAKRFGRIDVIVNNAGISGADKPKDKISAQESQKVMDVNVNGVFFCTKAAIPHMRMRAGAASSTFLRSTGSSVHLKSPPITLSRERCVK